MSSITTLIEDGKRIDPSLAPSIDELAGAFGVLVKHVEGIVGHELPPLADMALGIVPAGVTPGAAVAPAPSTSEAPSASSAQAELEAAERELAATRTAEQAAEARIVALRGQVQTPPAGAAGSGVTATGATEPGAPGNEELPATPA